MIMMKVTNGEIYGLSIDRPGFVRQLRPVLMDPWLRAVVGCRPLRLINLVPCLLYTSDAADE